MGERANAGVPLSSWRHVTARSELVTSRWPREVSWKPKKMSSKKLECQDKRETDECGAPAREYRGEEG